MRLKEIADLVRTEIYRDVPLASINDEALLNKILSNLYRSMKSLSEGRIYSDNSLKNVAQLIFSDIRGFGPLDELLKDDDITEILVNGPANIRYEKNKKWELHEPYFEFNEERLEAIIHRIAGIAGREINYAHPILEFVFDNKWTVNTVFPNVASEGAIIHFRKRSGKHFVLNDFVNQETISDELSELLDAFVKSHFNIIIGGNDEIERLDFLSCLINCIPPTDRAVIIQDGIYSYNSSPENIIKLTTQREFISSETLINTALRLKTDSLILSDFSFVKTKEVFTPIIIRIKMLLSTLNAYTKYEVLSKAESLLSSNSAVSYDFIQRMIADAIDIIIIVSDEGYITDISQVLGIENGSYIINSLYTLQYDIDSVKTVRTNNRIVDKNGKLTIAGYTRYLDDEVAEKYKYDVFVSYKSDDEKMVEKIFSQLTSWGLKVFLSSKTLPQLGTDAYTDAIYDALDQSRHMVVVSSDISYLHTGWVKSEWSYFLGEVREGRKEGNVILVLDDGTTINKKYFPPQLRHKEIIKLSEFEEKLLGYLR